MGNKSRTKSCGIYRIRNRVNGRFYVGSSIDIQKRFRTHRNDLRKNKHHSIKLQRAWNKYGESNFVFEIIEETFVELRLEREQKILSEQDAFYNVSLSAYAPMSGRKHSKRTIRKFKNRVQPSGPAHWAYGKKRSPEHIRSAAEARIGSKHSEITIKKMRETAIRLGSINRVDRDNTRKPVVDSLGNKFNSMVETAKFWNLSVQTICDILKGRHYHTRAKISFNYLHEEDLNA